MEIQQQEAQQQETRRLIAQALLCAEAYFFWFGYRGTRLDCKKHHKNAVELLREELVGIRTADLEGYRDELISKERKAEVREKELFLIPKGGNFQLMSIVLNIATSKESRLLCFAQALSAEIARRHGTDFKGGNPLAVDAIATANGLTPSC